MFRSIELAKGRAPADVIALFTEDRELPSRLPARTRSDEALRAARRTPGFKADSGETLAVGSNRFLLGLGKRADFTTTTARGAAARLVRALDRAGVRAVNLSIAEALDPKRHDTDAIGRAFGEGMVLANWRVDHFDGSATRRTPAQGALSVDSGDRAFRAALEHGLRLGESVNLTRRLGATPPNICHPAWVAKEARRIARDVGLRCEVIDYREAQRLGMGGLVSVGQASATKPCIVVLRHAPKRVPAAARHEHLVLVGKTITYDTGGYSLKVNNGMKGMKYDKMGGMAVLGAMHAIASLDLPVRVTGVLAVAENMVSGEAYRPDDIITMHNGVTVEVTNTDAEGRLVLADALSWACRKLDPTAIVDMATLTGGVVVALGHFSAGYFCGNDRLRSRLEAASAESGERLWQLPLWTEHRDYMRGQHADLINSNPGRGAHPIQGAAFLAYFVDDQVPWAHVDIAGMASVENANDLFVQGPTGYGVRLLTDLAEGFTRRA